MKAFFVFPLLVTLLVIFIPQISLAANPPSIFNGINIWEGAYCDTKIVTSTTAEGVEIQGIEQNKVKIGHDQGPPGPCGFCDGVIIASNIMRYMFELVFYILFPLFFAWGGIQYMLSAGNPSKVKQAKQILVSTVVGFLIAAAAWLIMGLFFHLLSSVSHNTNPDPNNVTPSINPWNKIDCGTN